MCEHQTKKWRQNICCSCTTKKSERRHPYDSDNEKKEIIPQISLRLDHVNQRYFLLKLDSLNVGGF